MVERVDAIATYDGSARNWGILEGGSHGRRSRAMEEQKWASTCQFLPRSVLDHRVVNTSFSRFLPSIVQAFFQPALFFPDHDPAIFPYSIHSTLSTSSYLPLHRFSPPSLSPCIRLSFSPSSRPFLAMACSSPPWIQFGKQAGI